VITRAAATMVAAMLVAALAPISAQAQAPQGDAAKRIVGLWRLVAMTAGGQVNPERGERATGMIVYDQHGLMNVQIMPDRPRPKWTGAPTPEQALEALSTYTAYWGTYIVDEAKGTVTHHRQGMLDGDIVDYVRRFELADNGNRIILTTVSGGTTNPSIRLTWERVR